MSATDQVLRILTQHYRREPVPAVAAVDLLARHDADTRAAGRLRDFTPVFTTSDGTDCPATELRCVLCNGLVQGVGPHTLLDLTALAARHDCQNTTKDTGR